MKEHDGTSTFFVWDKNIKTWMAQRAVISILYQGVLLIPTTDKMRMLKTQSQMIRLFIPVVSFFHMTPTAQQLRRMVTRQREIQA